jgi:hypothetical protein
MNWDAIGAVGQLLGSLAVFVTLGYLAVQVGQAKEQMRRSVTDGRAATARQLMLTQLTNPPLSDLFEKVSRDHVGIAALGERIGLTFSEAMAYNVYQVVWWQYRAQIIAQIDDLPSGERAAFDAALRLNYQHWQASSIWYKTAKSGGILNPDAVRYVDDLLAQPG